MPQASEELRNEYKKHFHTLDDSAALEYLASLGYKDDRGMFKGSKRTWFWLDEKAMVALDYLCEEWDYSYNFTHGEVLPNSYWYHRNGQEYKVLMLANDSILPTKDYPWMVVYQNTSNDTVWTRRLTDWYRSFTPRDGASS